MNKDDDTKHLIDIDKSISTEEKYAEQLGRLISSFSEFQKTPKEFSLLTRDMPIGWTKMSHATIYNIMNGKIHFNAMQLQEFARVMRISVMDILEEPKNNVKSEIVFDFNFKSGSCDPIPFNKPRQAIYFKNLKYQDEGMRCIIFRTENQLRNDSNVCMFNKNKDSLFRKDFGRDFMLNRDVLLKCALDDKYYLGKILKWTDTNYEDESKKSFTANFQWFKGTQVTKEGMYISDWEHRTDTVFDEIYPVEIWDLSLRHDHVIMDLL